MLVIEPTADGRLRISNNHRSGLVANEASARSLAYNWGHTDISINKALAEMRADRSGEKQVPAWRVGRPEARPSIGRAAVERAAVPPRREPAPARVETPAPVAETRAEPAPKKARARRTPAKAVAPTSAAAVKEPTPPAPVRPRRAAAKSQAPAPAPKPSAPTLPAAAPTATAPETRPKSAPKPVKTRARAASPAPAPQKAPEPPVAKEKPARAAAQESPRERALSLFRAGVKELVALEGEALPFARAPWSDLREMAEYVAACLEGKKPRSGWTREGK